MADEQHCACCDRRVHVVDWDWTYSSCHECAWCTSLEHYDPCHHGACKEDPVQHKGDGK
jgi:hypothetical protein